MSEHKPETPVTIPGRKPATPKRRFIAGAVCPECRAVDRLVVRQLEGGTQERTCVSCGFTDQVGPAQVGAVPRGKAERPTGSGTVPVQTVRVMDPQAPDSDPQDS